MLFGLLLAILIVPLETILISQFTIFITLGLVDTRLAVILPALAGAFNIYLFRNFFMAIPTEIIESAKLDGANTWQVFLANHVTDVQTGCCHSWDISFYRKLE